MRISDWSSDVCSSDLVLLLGRIAPPAKERPRFRGTRSRSRSVARLIVGLLPPVSPSDRQATRPPIIRLPVFGLGAAPARACREAARKSGGQGKVVSDRVYHGGRR